MAWAILDAAVWWAGAAVLICGATLGTLELLWWLADRIIKSLGLTKSLRRALQLMYEERRNKREEGAK